MDREQGLQGSLLLILVLWILRHLLFVSVFPHACRRSLFFLDEAYLALLNYPSPMELSVSVQEHIANQHQIQVQRPCSSIGIFVHVFESILRRMGMA